MTQQSILHLVVKLEVFNINIYNIWPYIYNLIKQIAKISLADSALIGLQKLLKKTK